MKWRRAGKRDLSQLLAFLLPNEWRAVPYTSRLRRLGKGAFPTPLEASVLICRESAEIRATMMLTSAGLLLPAFSGSEDACRDLPPGPFPGWGDLSFRLYSMMGPGAETAWLAGRLPLPPAVTVDYHLMVHDRESFSGALRDTVRSPAGLTVRTACARDFGALLPLQIRYELEEVVINRQRYSEQTSRQHLKQALRHQLVLMAEQDGRVVAKAGTNARGFTADQIGGVFTVENARNAGIAFRVMEELLRRIFAQKQTACLFVKKNNLAALSLYRKLGFRIAEGYRISYFKA
ncbi:MAG: GNAT family N-acetyltransferase [Spirochaetales bacterium]|nr:GNAT family N-acetyltransferase [Spirochaetales bacterium]